MTKLVALFVATALFSACAGTPDPPRTPRLHVSLAAPLWTPNGSSNVSPISIAVCWQTQGWDAEKALVMNAVKATWGRVSPIDFYEGCPWPNPRVNVYIYGGGCCGSTFGLGVGSTVYFNFDSVGPPTFYPIDRVRYQAVHEFGHALGFAHEGDSPLRPTTNCSLDVDGNVQAAAPNIVPVGGPFDFNSVMNSSNACNFLGNGAGYLSLGDIAGVRALYGTRIVKNRGDFDGDGRAEIGVWRPSNGTWYVPGQPTTHWGDPCVAPALCDVPVPGDYRGGGRDYRAVWRPSTGTWWVDDGVTVPITLGAAGDIPVPGDYDGDGKTDFAVWRPSTGAWAILMSKNRTFVTKTWGVPGDVPVPGDYDGDGKTDIAVWRPSSGRWYIDKSNGAYDLTLGAATDLPVPADYAGEGKIRPAVYTPSTGTWIFTTRPAITNGLATKIPGTPRWRMVWGGTAGDIPVPGSYGGSGIAEIGIWRRTTSPALYYIVGYTQGWGEAGDVPFPRYSH